MSTASPFCLVVRGGCATPCALLFAESFCTSAVDVVGARGCPLNPSEWGFGNIKECIAQKALEELLELLLGQNAVLLNGR